MCLHYMYASVFLCVYVRFGVCVGCKRLLEWGRTWWKLRSAFSPTWLLSFLQSQDRKLGEQQGLRRLGQGPGHSSAWGSKRAYELSAGDYIHEKERWDSLHPVLVSLDLAKRNPTTHRLFVLAKSLVHAVTYKTVAISIVIIISIVIDINLLMMVIIS